MDLSGLPGGDLVQEGLADLARGEETIPALLVSIGAPRLRRIGLPVPENAFPSPEMRLYERLAESDSDSAHSRSTPWCADSSASRTQRNAAACRRGAHPPLHERSWATRPTR